MNSLKRIVLFSCLFIVFSCAEKLDLNQIEDYVATPTYTASLTYFKVSPDLFVNASGVVTNPEINDITDFRVFENDYIRKNLVKVDFNVEVNNLIDRNFDIEVALLNDNNVSVYNFSNLNVSANELNFTHDEEVDISLFPGIKNATKVRVIIRMQAGSSPLSPQDVSEFEFKSSAKMYLEVSL